MASTLDYPHYAAKPVADPAPGRPRRSGGRLVTRLLHDGLLLPYGLLRHRRLMRRCRHLDDHTYTCFMRSPAQLALLSGPILDHLRPAGRLEILLLACSNGAEAYTIVSWLRRQRPELDVRIHASDLHPEMVQRAERAEYTHDEVMHSGYVTEGFLRDTCERHGDRLVVRPEIRACVRFSQASLLDGDDLRARFGQAPLVVAQNVLFHLPPEQERRAFGHLVELTAPGGAMLVAGMNLDRRVQLARRHGLRPFTTNLRDIHEEGRAHTPPHWWRVYWGAEPFLPVRRDRALRYATAFARPG